jgi:ribonuclease HI
VMNVELMKEIDAALQGRRYRFEWVKGHVGHELNEAADDRARAAATAYQRGAEPDAGPGFGGAPAAAPSGAPAAAAPALFEAEAPPLKQVVVGFSTAELRALTNRAKRAGTTPEQLLRSLALDER